MIRWPAVYSQTRYLWAAELSAGENKELSKVKCYSFKKHTSLSWCKQNAVPIWGTVNQEDKFYWREKKGLQLNHPLFHEGKNSKT